MVPEPNLFSFFVLEPNLFFGAQNVVTSFMNFIIPHVPEHVKFCVVLFMITPFGDFFFYFPSTKVVGGSEEA